MIFIIKKKLSSHLKKKRFLGLFRKYKSYTMIPQEVFMGNLLLSDCIRHLEGNIVECGVWRGGMSAALAEFLGENRKYYLFDSFEGLPPAKEIDGEAALDWQKKTDSPIYFDNCKADMKYAEDCMQMSGIKNYEIKKGWFADTLPGFSGNESIALLRLDADWYDSTMDCLKNLYWNVRKGGIIIIDDYYAWDGCCRAVHDFLSTNKLPERIRETHGVSYIIKR